MTEPNRKPLRNCTAAEMDRLCRMLHNLEPDSAERPSLLALLGSIGIKQDDVVTIPAHTNVPSAMPDEAPSPITENTADQFVDIIIDAQEVAGGDEPVPVQHNGSCIWIPRGEPVPVKRKYVEILRHSLRVVYDPLKGPMGGTAPPREVPNYPFRVVADPSALRPSA